MKRSVALLSLLAILAIGWVLYTFTGVSALFNLQDSPVLFSYGGMQFTLAMVVWIVGAFIGWVALVVLGYSIDPTLATSFFGLVSGSF